MDTQGAIKWLKTAVIAALGGGVAGSVAALSDPAKYRFPQDLGTGKMWPFFLTGAAVTFGALLVRSPLGQQTLKAYRDTQVQSKADQEELEKLKTELKERDKS